MLGAAATGLKALMGGGADDPNDPNNRPTYRFDPKLDVEPIDQQPMQPVKPQQTNLTPQDLEARAAQLKAPAAPAGAIPPAPAPEMPVATPMSAAPVDAPAPMPTAGPNSPVTSIVTDTVKEMIQETPAQPVEAVKPVAAAPAPVAPPPQQPIVTPSKEIRRFDDGGLEVGYSRGDSKILVTVAPQSKSDRMLSASLENIGGYPSKTGDATMAYVDALESVTKDTRGKPVYWDGFTSESVQSDNARAIYERLKAAGIPFETNVFDDRNKNALSLTQQQLLDIDFDEVRKNLIKNATQPVAPPQDLRTGTGKPAFAGMGPQVALNKKGQPKFKSEYADINAVPRDYAFVPGADKIDTLRNTLGQQAYTEAYKNRPFPLTNEMAMQEASEINRLLGRPTRAELIAAGLPPAANTPGITQLTNPPKGSGMGTKTAKVGGVLGALVAIPDLAKAETPGQRAMAATNLLEAILPPGFMMGGAGEGSTLSPEIKKYQENAMLLGSPYAQSPQAKKLRQEQEYVRKIGAGRGIAPPSAYQR